ncbi:MAG: class I SAM-dependent methyltransferase [Gemmatimonadaceae bacterium]
MRGRPVAEATGEWLDHSRQVLRILFGEPARRGFAVRYWDGTVEGDGDGGARVASGDPGFTLVLKHPWTLRRMLLPATERRLVEAYIDGDVDAEGDMELAAGLGELIAAHARPRRLVRDLLPHLLALPARPEGNSRRRRRWGIGRPAALGRKHTRARDRAAVRYHYDVGNEFFQLFLGEHLMYSCAYFETGDETLDRAQEAKLEHTCRKLRLVRGERLLDIGCGWGGAIIYAARHYGVSALGITLSELQAAEARKRIAAAGLADSCHVEVRDYRELADDGASFDKLLSIGMVEHVGHAGLQDYFARAYSLLRPGGLFLSHGIVTLAGARAQSGAARAWRERRKRRGFIQQYVFPDSQLVPLGAHVTAAERAGFESRDVESLREHYALTLRHWVRRLEANYAEAARRVGEETYRVWRLYMAAAARQFAGGKIGVDQLLLAKPFASGNSGMPLTRSDLYR